MLPCAVKNWEKKSPTKRFASEHIGLGIPLPGARMKDKKIRAWSLARDWPIRGGDKPAPDRNLICSISHERSALGGLIC